MSTSDTKSVFPVSCTGSCTTITANFDPSSVSR
jgi:hypothetical protein